MHQLSTYWALEWTLPDSNPPWELTRGSDWMQQMTYQMWRVLTFDIHIFLGI